MPFRPIDQQLAVETFWQNKTFLPFWVSVGKTKKTKKNDKINKQTKHVPCASYHSASICERSCCNWRASSVDFKSKKQEK